MGGGVAQKIVSRFESKSKDQSASTAKGSAMLASFGVYKKDCSNLLPIAPHGETILLVFTGFLLGLVVNGSNRYCINWYAKE
jgi:hypothetical protein